MYRYIPMDKYILSHGYAADYWLNSIGPPSTYIQIVNLA